MYPGSDVLIKTIHVYNSTSWNGVKSLSGGNGAHCTHTHYACCNVCEFCVWLIERIALSCIVLLCVCVFEYVWLRRGEGFAGGFLRCSAKKTEYPGVGWNKWEWERWGSGGGVQRGGKAEGGFDLDGGYHNRLKTVFSSVSAPCVSRRGSGGASREGPGQMTSLPYGI